MQTIDDFLRTGAMTPYMARFLDAAVKAKLNIIYFFYLTLIC